MSEKILKVQTSGRLNLIGEHVDHQLGLVLPIAIGLKITFFASRRNDKSILVYSRNFEQEFVSNIDIIAETSTQEGSWFNYVIGIIQSFQSLFPINSGFNICIDSSLPQGSGLSSSAAFEIGFFTVLEKLFNYTIDPLEVVKICWQTENEFIGVKCGIMDQFIVRFGQENKALKINCSDLTYQLVKLPNEVSFLVLDTKIKHTLINSPYNSRIEECKIALRKINVFGFNVVSISQLSLDNFNKIEKTIENPYRLRIKHVIDENIRVEKFFSLLTNFSNSKSQESLQKLGNLLYESHKSLKENFDASWDRANVLIDYCKTLLSSGVYGARMVGGGWGGSVLILIDQKHSDSIKFLLNKFFFQTFKEKTTIYSFKSSIGTEFSTITRNEIPTIFQTYFS
jgi:galactokinase